MMTPVINDLESHSLLSSSPLLEGLGGGGGGGAVACQRESWLEGARTGCKCETAAAK